MKKFWLILLSVMLLYSSASAEEDNKLIKKINYLQDTVQVVGLPDFPPFSYYERGADGYVLKGAFIRPIMQIAKQRKIDINPIHILNSEKYAVKLLLIDVRAGTYQMFIGANSDTKLYKGLELVFPSIISNPIHIITLPDKQQNIKSFDDLKTLRGIICRSEYFSDFVLRKAKELNVTIVDTPYDAYKMLFTDQADYMLGSLYYNKIMAIRNGIENDLAFSNMPLYKTPVFIALSKVMPLLSEYLKAFKQEFSTPEFAKAVKQEIINIIDAERIKYDGVVPPSFATEETEDNLQIQENEDTDNDKVENKNVSGHIIEEEKAPQRTIEEVLEGI